MTKGDLEGVRIWGRPIKPVALGLSVSMLMLVVINVADTGEFTASVAGDVVAVLAGISFGTLMWGWFGRSQRMAEVGLLAACATYVLRSMLIWFDVGILNPGVPLGLGGAIIASGAYLLERWDTGPHRGAG